MRLLTRMLMALGLFVGILVPQDALASGPLVLAASSLQEALTSAADRWTELGHERPVLSFAASSALARQVEAGAPADIFISADEAWMDDVAAKRLVRPGTRISFLRNRLVLVAPRSSRVALAIRPGFPIARALGGGRLAMGDPASVPAGRYGREALTRLGVWSAVAGRVAGAENVRAALTLVERGEAPLGIVYATDALASEKVRVVGVFPEASHTAITYPLALLATSSNPDARGFRHFLIAGEAGAIFVRHGFMVGR